MKYISWAIGALIVFYLISNPEGAAQTVDNALDGAASAGNSLITFINELG